MAVTSLLTLVSDMEGTPTILSPGSGGGGGTNTDVFIEANQSISRRVDNATNKGVGVQVAAIDMSAAGVHVVAWQTILQWGALSNHRFRLGDGTNNDDHTVPASYVPALGGFIPIWLDVSRTPETGGSANEAALTDFVTLGDMANVGGTSDNWIMDAVHYGTSGYRWTGTGGDLDAFVTYETNNDEGVLAVTSGVIYCFARIEIGTASEATLFTDLGKILIFPDQPLVADTFMGVSISLQNSGNVISLTDGVLASGDPTGATTRPDYIVTGNLGTLDGSRYRYDGLRIVTLTDACTFDDCVFANCGVITAAGASMLNTSVLTPNLASSPEESALVWDVNTDPDGFLDGMTFSRTVGVDHHAIELGTTSPTTVTLRDMTFTGFDTTDEQPDSVVWVRRTSGNVTINAVGVTGTVSVKSDGANVTVVADSVTVTVTCIDRDGNPVQGARVLLRAANATGPFPFQESISISNSDSPLLATVTHTAHGMATGDYVQIKGSQWWQNNGVHQITKIDNNSYSYPLVSYPGASPTPGGEATFVALWGLSNASGVVTASRVYATNQPVSGRARKSSFLPYYQTATLQGLTVSSTAGLAASAVMILDE